MPPSVIAFRGWWSRVAPQTRVKEEPEFEITFARIDEELDGGDDRTVYDRLKRREAILQRGVTQSVAGDGRG